MREPPRDLSHDALRGALSARYGLAAVEIGFLPLGHDALAWVYQVRAADGSDYFLKAHRGAISEPGLLVHRFLEETGNTAAIAPLPDTAGRLWTEIAGYSLVLYPFIAGVTGKDGGMTPEHWIEFGAALRRVHDATPPLDLAQRLPRETFVPYGADLVRRVEPVIAGERFDDEARTPAAFWAARRETIHTLMERAEMLGRRLAAQAPPFVLCHADTHTANVLIDAGGHVRIVDWDGAVLAPRERDLMFVLDGGISDRLVRPEDEALFLQGYGPVAADPLALAYYRYAWAASDIGEYAVQVFQRLDLGRADRQEGAERFMSLFEPGEIVSKALGSPITPHTLPNAFR